MRDAVSSKTMTMKFARAAFALAAAIAVCAAACLFGAKAFADDGSQAGSSPMPAGYLTTQGSYGTSYAILKSDGYLHRTNADHSVDYGKLWGDDENEARNALNGVTTLFIDSSVTSISNVKAQHKWGSERKNVTITLSGSTGYMGTHNLKTIEFLLNSSGVNQCSEIEMYCFSNHASLTTVKNFAKTKIAEIPLGAFDSCKNLTSISIPATAAKIGQDAFWNCSDLKSVTIPKGVATIDTDAFQGCSLLTSINMPASVKTINAGAFKNCIRLKTVKLRSTTRVAAGYDAFFNTPIFNDGEAGYIYVPNKLVSQYKSNESSNQWKSLASRIRPINPVGWVKRSGKWYYLDSLSRVTTGWQKVSGKWYWLGSDGAMRTSWQKISGKWYYLGSNGAMRTGWQKASGKWYLLNSSGAMLTGWQKSGGKWYYLGSDGAMRTGWQKIGGEWYWFNSSGAWA